VFGDLATIRRKLQVLERHCEEVGRDPAEITKTRLGGLLIAPTAAEAQRRLQQIIAAMGVDEATFRNYVTAGDPDAVAEQVAPYLEAGIDGLVFNMMDAHDLEPVALAGETLVKRFGGLELR
jgi:alkanesulfonate monooxygenase SsuD/methylene tetrahydromethanopterin reductase-like flavin-dependent oxidoreductase (luciferase family)